LVLLHELANKVHGSLNSLRGSGNGHDSFGMRIGIRIGNGNVGAGLSPEVTDYASSFANDASRAYGGDGNLLSAGWL